MDVSRQVSVLGKKVQGKISSASIAIIGVGALGSVSCELLARSGVKELILVDRDILEESNLQRQALYVQSDVGVPKVFALAKHLMAINPSLKVKPLFIDVTAKNIGEIGKPTLILDGTDNLETRFLLNEYCVKKKINWIYASAISQEGYVQFIDGKGCLRCYLSPASLETCEGSGVLGSLTHLIASLQVQIAFKYFSGDVDGSLYYVNLDTIELRKLKTPVSKNCKVCSLKEFSMLEGQEESIVKMCGKGFYQIKMDYEYDKIKKRLKGKDLGYGMKVGEVLVLPSRVLVYAKNESEARKIVSEVVGK